MMTTPMTSGRVLITGASTGIGEACARRLDAAGWHVFAGVRRDEDAARLRAALSGRATPVLLDVTDESSIARAAQIVRSTGDSDGGLDALVNNAGIAVAGPLEYLPIADIRRQLEVNVVGQLAVTQACLPMLRLRRGRLVLMGSIAGRLTLPFLGPYSASKQALEALADALRVELQPWDMPVVLLEPGSIATPIWGKGAADAQRMAGTYDKAARTRYGAAIAKVQDAAAAAARRGIHPDEVARVVERALTSRNPRPRYVVGRDARLQLFVRAIPDRLRDRLLTRGIGLPARGSQR
ncbi:MAG TPA: SDR family oxidoreductase [Vicinamibacterales bacterium]|nr:SDR family oxidoreductase [Vicinamibacterales bacterium]